MFRLQSLTLLTIITIGSFFFCHAHPPIENPEFLAVCAKETGITIEDMKKETAPSEKSLCFFKCILETGGFIQDDKFNKESFQKIIDMGKASADCLGDKDIVIKECSDVEQLESCFKPK